MSIKILNEGFELLHKNSLCEEKSNSSDLEKALESALNHLAMRQEMNIKKYEIAFQDAIESQYPDKSWWEVTDCDIFSDLAENRDPSLTIKHILAGLKPKLKEAVDEDSEKEFKVRFYKIGGKDEGKLDHEEFFDTKEDAVKAFNKVFKKELFSLNPTVWKKQGKEWKRILNSEMKEAKQRKSKKAIEESLRRKRLSEDETIKRYSDHVPQEKRKYWYFTTHGVQPGSIPKDLHVLEVRDGENERGTQGTFVMLDGVLNTSELRYYDMRELAPKEETEKRRMRPQGERITAWESYKKKNHIRESYDEKIVIYKDGQGYKATPESNYRARIQNARKIQNLKDFDSADEIIDYYVKYGWAKGRDDFEVIDECKLDERNLTRAERHNRDMEKIFNNKKEQDKKFANFLKKNGYSDESIEKLRKQDKLSAEIASKFTPKGKQPSDILGKILGESSKRKSKKSIKESFAKKHAKKLKESHRRKLTESFDDMEVFMNTWANYNEYGADGVLTPTGWMSIDDAIEYCEEYADYEPFINDTDNVPFDDINEYSNASSTLQELKELQESGVDEDVLEAIIEATGYSVKEAIEIAERGDYYWYPGISSYTDLAYAVIDEIGSLKDALGDRVVNYIDEDQMRREYRWDIREIMRDTAEQEVDDAHDGEVDISNVPTSKEFSIDEWFDEDDEYTEDDLREQISDDLEYEYDSAPISFDIEVSNDGKKVTAKNIEWDGYDREQEIEDWMDEHEDEWLDMIIGEEIEAAERGEADLSSYFDYEAFGRDLSFDGYTITDKGIILVM